MSISRKTSLLFLVLVVLACVNAWLVYDLSNDAEATVNVLGVAARTRTMAHELTEFVQQVASGKRTHAATLPVLITFIDRSVGSLRSGGSAIGQLGPAELTVCRSCHADGRESRVPRAELPPWPADLPERSLRELEAAWAGLHPLLLAAGSGDGTSRAGLPRDEMNAFGTRIVRALDDLVQLLADHQTAASQRMHWWTAGLVVVNLLALAMGFFRVRKFVYRPIRALERAAKEIGAGDLATRVRIRTDDELGRLGASFNGMADSIQSATGRLRASEARFRLLVESLPDAVLIHRDGRVVFANPPAARLVGREGAEGLVGASMVEFAPAPRSEVLQAAMDMLARGVLPPVLEVQLPQPDGTHVDLEVISLGIELDGLPAILSVARNVTERKRLQEQMLQAGRLASVGTLAAGVAHDFNNLVAVIISYGDFLAAEFAEDDPRRQDIDEIRRAGKRAAALTRQLLAFSRRETGRREPLDLNAVVADVEKLLRRTLGEQVVLRTVLASGLPNVCADVGELEQVLINLGANARDAMPGGGTLALETAEVRLDDAYVRAHPYVVPGAYVRLTVRDTGSGMDPQTRERAFDPFFTTKPFGQGTGLGLAIVYGIVKRANGYVELQSEPGRGTAFEILLPVVEGEAGRSASERPPAAGLAGRGELVLVVEDDDAVRALTRRILSVHGYEVLEARDGIEALMLAERCAGPIDLLLTDVVMPGMSGKELAERFGARRAGAAVVFVSAGTEETLEQHGLVGAQARLVRKPFIADVLLGQVRQALDSREVEGRR
ncbi:MAG: response regulator [Deltaproteobacteria bacterium]|nr:response regulator [Deltaproteobacteria bacterium]